VGSLDDSLVNRAAPPGSMRYFSLLYAPEDRRDQVEKRRLPPRLGIARRVQRIGDVEEQRPTVAGEVGPVRHERMRVKSEAGLVNRDDHGRRVESAEIEDAGAYEHCEHCDRSEPAGVARTKSPAPSGEQGLRSGQKYGHSTDDANGSGRVGNVQ